MRPKARRPPVSDLAASAGRLEVPTGWSVAAASAHKWGGPAGVPALQAGYQERAEVARRQRRLVDLVRAGLAAIGDVDVVGDPDDRLPHVVTFSCLYIEGEALVTELDRQGFAVSSGSACSASTLEPSGPVDLEVDCRGMRCPLPVSRWANSIGDVAVAVVADDPAARPGLAAWCRMRGQESVGEDTAADDVAVRRTAAAVTAQ